MTSYQEMVNVPFSKEEVLNLHAALFLMDGHAALVRLLKKRITPVAMELLKAEREAKVNELP